MRLTSVLVLAVVRQVRQVVLLRPRLVQSFQRLAAVAAVAKMEEVPSITATTVVQVAEVELVLRSVIAQPNYLATMVDKPKAAEAAIQPLGLTEQAVPTATAATAATVQTSQHG
jgi:hypothetical protein